MAGLLPKTGVGSWQNMHAAAAAPYAARRRVYYLNRRPDLPPGITFPQLAAEHAAAIRHSFDEPVDLLGLSTGGSIAQQVSADHPDVVRRLALLSTGYRLSDHTREQMRRIAARIRAGAPRDRFYPMALIEQTAALIPNSRMVIEPEHGHMTVTGVPSVHKAILDHLDEG